MWNRKLSNIFGSEFSDRTKTFQKGWWSWGYHTNLSIDELPQSDFPFYRSASIAEKEFFYFFKDRIIPPSLGGFPTNKYGHFLRSCHEGERLNFLNCSIAANCYCKFLFSKIRVASTKIEMMQSTIFPITCI